MHTTYTQFACNEYLIIMDMSAENTVTLKIRTLSSEQVEPFRIDLCTYIRA